MSMNKTIAIMGSTGSIGTQTLEVVRANPGLKVSALSAGRNISLLEKQIREFSPKVAAVWDARDAAELAARTADLDIEIVPGMEGLLRVAEEESSDVLVTAIVGMIGIEPTIRAIEAGKDIALANKETLVCAGHLIMPLAEENHVKILPVDSEHSAIFQCLNGDDRRHLSRIWLTASGGPFRGMSYDQLKTMRPEDALKHPNWNMGSKITIDSASMVNKGLEVMEARWLFGTDLDQIKVVIQPQSIIHSMVEFEDGAVMAQLGTPDMKLPIQYALSWPERRPLAGERLDFARLGSITFEEPDPETFRGLKLAREAAQEGGSMPTVFNAANEYAVAAFLSGKIGFTEIYDIIGTCMERHAVTPDPDVETILGLQDEIRREVERGWM